MAILMAILFRKPLDGECPNVDLDVIKTAAEKRQQNSSRMYLSMFLSNCATNLVQEGYWMV